MTTPNNLLLIDCETTGTDPQKDKLCEIGAILFSVKHKAVIQQLSFLCPVQENPAFHVNKIPADLLDETMSTFLTGEVCFDALEEMFSAADACVAHNAEFDRQWVPNWMLRKPWICTCSGISWPDLRPRPSLRDLALHYGVPVWAAHRALTDCTYMAQVFERDELLEEHLSEGLLPQKLVCALVGFEGKELAKAAGFYWAAETKKWMRKCNEKQIAALPFHVRVVSD